jgi:hypothetical protein
MTDIKSLKIGPKTIEEWDSAWAKVEGSLRERRSEFDGKVGLYRVRLDGGEKVIGRAVEIKGGLAKRIYDFGRTSDSGRKHKAGRLIHQHLDQIEVEVLITNDLSSNPVKLAKDLRGPMVDLHQPEWTVRARYRKRKPKNASLVTKARPYTGTIPKG